MNNAATDWPSHLRWHAERAIIIDLPQAIDAAANNNAAGMLKRDVHNITAYFSRFAPALASTRYGDEIWSLYQSAALHPDVALTGRFTADARPADVAAVLQEIEAVRTEHEARERYKALLRE